MTPPPSEMTAVTTVYPFWGSFKRFVRFPVLLASVSPVQWYAVWLGCGAVVLGLAASTLPAEFSASPLMLAVLVGVAVAAERQSVQIGSNTQMSVAALPILFAAVAYGPLPAMLVGGSSVLLDFGRPHARWVIWTSSRAIAGGLAGVAVLVLPFSASTFVGAVAAVAIAASVEALVDVLFNTLTVTIRRSGSFVETITSMSRLLLSTIPLYTPVVAGVVHAYREVSPWTVILFFLPALAAQRLLVLYQEQRTMARSLRAVNSDLEEANLSFAGALVSALDARDHYTAGHSAAVAIYARDICARLELDEEVQSRAHLCGLLHDIGKVGLPPGLIEKEGLLTVEERAAMQQHAAIGERILSNVRSYHDVARIVRHHHERVDGSGYPDRLSGDAIPLLSRVIAVADAYNAMTSGRSYREAMEPGNAFTRLHRGAGSQFDPVVVRAFLALLDSASPTYLIGARADFALEAQKALARTSRSLRPAA